MEENLEVEELDDQTLSPTAVKDDYMIVNRLAAGKFSTIFRAVNTSDDPSLTFYAVKRNIFASVAEREIRALKKLEGVENVVKIFDFFESPAVLSIVLELCREDFFQILILRNISVGLPEIKYIIHQFLQGLQAIHSQNIMHRDIKSGNLLLTFDGLIKICDFGSSRQYEPAEDGSSEMFTNNICSLWYKAPELLLGDRKYSDKIDLWSAGCVMFELWSNQILFKGNTERLQLISITQTCGFISEDVWDDVKHLDGYCKYRMWGKKYSVSHLRDKLDKVTASNKAAVDLMLSLLNLNPHQRKSAEDLLGHEFFGGSLPPANNLNKLMRRLDKSPPDVEVPSYLQEAFFCRNEKENMSKSAEEPTVKQSVVDEETQTGGEESD